MVKAWRVHLLEDAPTGFASSTSEAGTSTLYIPKRRPFINLSSQSPCKATLAHAEAVRTSIPGGGREATGETLDKEFDANAFVKDFVKAMNQKNADTLLEYYADDAEVRDPSTPKPVHGKQAIRANLQSWSRSFGDLDFRVKDVVRSGNKVALLIDARARHTGPIPLGPSETARATNKVVNLEVGEFLTLRQDGKITSDHTVFDMASMMQQLGIVPTPART